ncbi:hypothetical protein [Streptomyces sp. NPDC054808]
MRAANVKDGALDLTDVKSMNFTPAEQQIFSLRAGDVLVTEGSGSLRSVGASAVWRGEIGEVVCFQNTLLRMRPRPGITDGRFLEWWARSAYGSGLFASVATGANIYHISAERVRTLPIGLPPLEEQRRIAAFLDAETSRMDRLANSQLRLTHLLKEREETKIDQTLRDAASHVMRLKYLLKAPPSYGANEAAEHRRRDWPRYIRTTDITEDGGLREETFASLPSEAARPYLLDDGDLLFVRSGATAGKSFLYESRFGPAAHAGYLIRARVDHKMVLPRLVWYFSRTPTYWQQISEGTIQATIQNVNAEKYGNLLMPYVEPSRQVSTLRELDSLTGWSLKVQQRAHRLLDLLAERRRALITAAVTGQFDVSTASGRNVTEGVTV